MKNKKILCILFFQMIIHYLFAEYDVSNNFCNVRDVSYSPSITVSSDKIIREQFFLRWLKPKSNTTYNNYCYMIFLDSDKDGEFNGNKQIFNWTGIGSSSAYDVDIDISILDSGGNDRIIYFEENIGNNGYYETSVDGFYKARNAYNSSGIFEKEIDLSSFEGLTSGDTIGVIVAAAQGNAFKQSSGIIQPTSCSLFYYRTSLILDKSVLNPSLIISQYNDDALNHLYANIIDDNSILYYSSQALEEDKKIFFHEFTDSPSGLNSLIINGDEDILYSEVGNLLFSFPFSGEINNTYQFMDNIANYSDLVNVRTINDDIKPYLLDEQATISYIDIRNLDKFSYIFSQNITDAQKLGGLYGSGLYQYSEEISVSVNDTETITNYNNQYEDDVPITNNQNEEGNTIIISNPYNPISPSGVYILTDSFEKRFDNFLYDIKYLWKVSFIDNLFNVADNLIDIVFGRTRPPKIGSGDSDEDPIVIDGNTVIAKVQLGKQYDDDDIGIESIHFSYGDISYGKEILMSDIIEIEPDDNGFTVTATVEFSIPPEIALQKGIDFSVYGEYKNSNDSDPVLYHYMRPNTELAPDSNDIALTVMNSQGIAYPSLSMNDSTGYSENSYIFFYVPESVDAQQNGYTIDLFPSTDIEDDVLTLVLTAAEDNSLAESIDIVSGHVLFSSNYPLSNIGVKESYQVSDRQGNLIDQNILKTFSVQLESDDSLILDGGELNTEILYDMNGDGKNYLFWEYHFPDVVTDKSGIQSIIVDCDYTNDESFEKTFSFRGTDDFNGAVFNGSFLLDELEEGTDLNVDLRLSINDWAGNNVTISPSVYYDYKNPIVLESSRSEDDGTGSVLGLANRDTDENDLYFSSYDNTGKEIRIKLDCSDFTGNEICTITPSMVSFGYAIGTMENGTAGTFIDTDPESMGTDGEAFVTITYTGEDTIPSNERLRFTLSYEDRAGNVSVQDYFVYTPCFLDMNFTDYVHLSEDQYDAILGHNFKFEKLTDTVDFEISRYTEVGGRELGASSLSFGDDKFDYGYYLDPHNVPHEYGQYLMLGKNGSGYCYDNSGANPGLKETFEGKNNIPVLTRGDSLVNGVFADDSYILGPESTWNYVVTDPDEEDEYVIKAFLSPSGQEPTEDDLITLDEYGSLLDGGNIDLSSLLTDDETLSSQKNYVINGQEYTLYLLAEDSWTSRVDGEPQSRDFCIADEGAETFNFTYDNESPSLVYQYEKNSGYSYIYGDINLSVTDNAAGLQDISLDDQTSDSLEGFISLETLSDSEYSHRISDIPDSTELNTVYLELIDNVGNSNRVSIGPFAKDSLAPVLDSVGIKELTPLGSTYYLNDLEVPVSLTWSDGTSGGEDVEYRFYQEGENVFTGKTSVGSSSKSEPAWDLFCSLSGYSFNNDIYELRVRLFDKAGNGSEWMSVLSSLVFDTTSPVIRITGLSGGSLYGGAYYLNRDNDVTLSTSLTEVNPASEDPDYRIQNEEVTLTGNNLADLLDESSVSDGEEYELSVGIADLAGNFGWSEPVTLRIDETAPAMASDSLVYGGNATSFYSGGQFRFSLENVDDDLAGFFVTIGQEEDGTFQPSLSELITGHLSDGSVAFSYIPGSVYNINIPDVESGNYTIQVYGVDHTGNVGAMTEMDTHLPIDNSQGRVIVKDSSIYTNNSHALSAYWEYKEGEDSVVDEEDSINGYYYRIYSVAENQPVTAWNYTSEGSADYLFENALTNGDTYFFEVYAVFDSGHLTYTGYSSGAIVDLVAPDVQALSLPEYSTLSGLSLSWSASDSETFIESVEAMVEIYDYDDEGNLLFDTEEIDGNEIKTARKIVSGPYMLGNGETGEDVAVFSAEEAAAFDLPDGESLFVVLRITDRAGNVKETSAGVCIKDDSAPPSPVVIDLGDYVNPLYNSLAFDWTHSPIDGDSGFKEYTYQILADGTSPGDEWIPIDGNSLTLTKGEGDDIIYTLSDGSELTLDNGSHVRMALRVTNRAGLSTVGYSNGIILDTSKPEIPIVKLGIVDEGDFVSLNYLLDEDLNLSFSSLDLESDISEYAYEPVFYEEGQWKSLGDEVRVYKADGEIIAETVPETLDDYEVLYYKVSAYNNTGDASTMPGYSNGAANYNDVPVITDAVGQASDGTIMVTWNVENDIPLEAVYLELEPLFGSSYTVSEMTVSGSLRTYCFTDVPDGFYRARLTCKAVYGTVSDTEVVSNAIVVDSDAPLVSAFQYDAYVYDTLNYSFAMADSLSGIAGYRYRVGTVGQPDLLTQGWVVKNTSAAVISGSISIEDELSGGIDSLNPADGVLLSVQAVDRCGNWSDISYSNPIIIDRTAPATPTVSMNRVVEVDQELTGADLESYTRDNDYIVSSTEIGNLIINSLDGESGLKSYRWAVRATDDTSDLTWSDFILLDGDSIESSTIEASLDTEGILLMEDNLTYRTYIETRNQVGLVSEWGVSGDFLADFTAPLFEIDGENSGVGYVNGKVIVNGTDSVTLTDVVEESDILIMDYSWDNADGEVVSEGTAYYFGRENFSAITVPFELPEGSDNGNYELTVTLKDSGGFATTKTQSLRYNAAPVVTVSELSTNPKRPLAWDVWSSVYDADGVTEVSLEVLDYQGEIVDQSEISAGLDYTIELGHPDSTPLAQHSVYTLAVTATDGFGQTSTNEVTLNIYNTSEGLLYTNEYWSDGHWLTGLVTIPEGLGLTVADGASIKMNLTDEDDAPGLLVEEGATLSHEGSATYEWGSEQSSYWQGIFMKGEGDLNGITISGASRGIILDSESVISLQNINFDGNLIGLHLLGYSPEIQDCTFTNNVYYGVKEEGDCTPSLSGNTFSENGYDYYDSEETVMDGDQAEGMSAAGNGN